MRRASKQNAGRIGNHELCTHASCALVLRFRRTHQNHQRGWQNHCAMRRRLRLGSLLLRTSQLAPATIRNNNRSDHHRKISKAIVDLSRRQADQNLSKQTGLDWALFIVGRIGLSVASR